MDILEELNGSTEPNAETQPQEPGTAEAPPTEQVEAAPTETVEQKAERERDERGRFKAKEEKPETPPGYVPIGVVQELREEIRSLKQPQQQPQPQAAPIPDIFEDPEGYVRFQNLQLQQATLNTTLNISEEMTRASAGSETVDEAQKWGAQAFAQNPAFYQQFLQQRNPYGFLVEHYKRATTFAKLGDDPSQIEAFIAWRDAQSNPPQPKLAVPTSLADQQSARGSAVPYQPPSLDEILRG